MVIGSTLSQISCCMTSYDAYDHHQQKDVNMCVRFTLTGVVTISLDSIRNDCIASPRKSLYATFPKGHDIPQYLPNL